MDGMFAFTIWDYARQELIIARDKSGKKPLYFTEINGQFIFASELRAIHNFRSFKREINLEKVYDFFFISFSSFFRDYF